LTVGRQRVRSAIAALLALGVAGTACRQPSPRFAAGRAESGAREPARAEFAVRWDPSEGGLASAEEVLAFLGAPRSSPSVFAVRYFDLPPPADAPPDSTAILRWRRSETGQSEIRLKYRRRAPLGKDWGCPAGSPFERKEEVDVSFTAAGPPMRVYAYSCTLAAGEPPASLDAVPKKCASRMARYEVEGFKVEEWTFSGGKVQVEVSRSAPNTAEELSSFERFVSKLLKRGVKPSDRSKTEAGSECSVATEI
jgi:hypothetical protein